MRRSDIKQLRRRLTCSAIRVWQQYTDVEKRLNDTFVFAQKIDVLLAGPGLDLEHPDTQPIKARLKELGDEAKTLSELATWYRSGHEQLNSMIAFAEQTIKEMA